ncbi:MAG: sodium:proton antiporter [Nitrospirota bacterium]|nr:sodium:proton antiporter [Nitrospirota bacterium]
MPHAAIHALALFAVILIIGIFIARIAVLIRVPDIILFIVAGIIVGPEGLGVVTIPSLSTVNNIVLVMGVSYIIFGGAIRLKFVFIRRVAISLVLLATVGVTVSAVLTGLTAQYALGLSFTTALLLGMILAPTDPAALIPVFNSVRVKDKLVVTGISESALNDATGAAMVFALIPVVAAAGSGSSAGISLMPVLINFLKMSFGGLVVGLVVGYLFSLFVSTHKTGILTEFATVLTIPAATGAYLIAETMQFSGFMAVFFAGLAIGNADVMRINIDDRCHHKTEVFIEEISLLLRIGIFILLGSQLNFEIMGRYLWPSIIIVAVFMLVARPVSVLSCLPFDRRAGWKLKEMAFMFWVRETGAMPAALVGLLLSQGVPQAQIISSVVFVAILATMLIQATTTEFVARRLGLTIE